MCIDLAACLLGFSATVSTALTGRGGTGRDGCRDGRDRERERKASPQRGRRSVVKQGLSHTRKSHLKGSLAHYSYHPTRVQQPRDTVATPGDGGRHDGRGEGGEREGVKNRIH